MHRLICVPFSSILEQGPSAIALAVGVLLIKQYTCYLYYDVIRLRNQAYRPQLREPFCFLPCAVLPDICLTAPRR